MSKPLKAEQIDISKVCIDKLKVKKYEKTGLETKHCRMTYSFDGNKKELFVKVPLTVVPFGRTVAKEYENEAPRKFKKYSLDFNVSGTPELEVFASKIEELDNKNIDFILSQCQSWWGKTPSGKPWNRDIIQDSSYTSLIKKTPEEKGDYPARFKMKLPFYDGVPRFKVYDANNNKINWVKEGKNGEDTELDWSWAQPNMKIEAIMVAEGLWEVNKKVFCTFRAEQIRVHPPDTLKECAFDDDEDEEVENAEVSENSKENVKENTKENTNVNSKDVQVEDDDEEAEEEEDATDAEELEEEDATEE